MKDVIFKVEDSLWQMLASGEKTWDARRHDMGDDRIYHLSWFQWHPPGDFPQAHHGGGPTWRPTVASVAFKNKVTGEILQFRYRGMEFTPWSPGWCFLILGELENRYGHVYDLGGPT